MGDLNPDIGCGWKLLDKKEEQCWICGGFVKGLIMWKRGLDSESSYCLNISDKEKKSVKQQLKLEEVN